MRFLGFWFLLWQLAPVSIFIPCRVGEGGFKLMVNPSNQWMTFLALAIAEFALVIAEVED